MQQFSLLQCRKQNRCPRHPPVSKKCCTWDAWQLAGCSCPWAGHGSLYQFHDISSAPKDIQQLSRSCRILPWSGQSCFASTETTRRHSSVHLKPCRGCFAAGTWRGEMRDQRTLQQLMAGNGGAHPFCHLDVGVHGGLLTDPNGLGGSQSHRFCLDSYTNW